MKALRHIAPAILMAVLLAGCASTRQKDKTADWSAQQLYLSGRKAMFAHQYDRAIERFQSLEARYPYGDYARRAELDVAYAYYKNDDSEAAVRSADRYIRLHPTDPNADFAYYLKGIAEFNAHRSAVYRLFGKDNLIDRDDKSAQAAISAFREVVQRYPNGPYAHDAYQRLVYLTDLLARNAVDVARYYYKHGAYVATVNRTKVVIDQFQQTPSVEEALALQALAYRKMGFPDLSDASLQVLKTNFPHSPYIARIESTRVANNR